MFIDQLKKLISKIINKIAIEKNRIWKYCDVERVSCFGYVGFPDATSFKARLIEMLGINDIDVLIDINENDRKTIMTSAQQVLSHKFDILGSGV